MKVGPMDAHHVGALLKQWLRDLPEPVLPDYGAALPEVPEGRDRSAFDAVLFDGPDHLLQLLASLPDANRRALLRLSRFLVNMCAEDVVAKTKMGLDNLCTVFSQCVMRNPSTDPFSLLKNQPREHRLLHTLLKQFNQLEQ
jgi:hypothetical protein